MARWIVVGSGYTGTAVAHARAAAGDDVIVTRRTVAAATASAAAAGPGVAGAVVDLANAATLAALTAAAAGAIVVCCAPPGVDPAGELRALVAALPGARRLVYVSSTGVYGPAAGAWVDEHAPLAPLTAAGRARVAAEAALADAAAAAGLSWIALRAAGIYGPDRGLVARLRAGTYRIIGDGSAHVSRIHVADLAAAIVAAGTSSVTGAVNIADDDPAPIGTVADELAAALGVPAPPRVPAASVDPEVAGMLTADRRIANQRLIRELGVVLRYPSWRSMIAEA